MEKYKKVQEKRDLYIQFSEEEIAELGWKGKQKLSIDVLENGSLTLKPFVDMEVEMSEWPRELLEYLVSESCDRDESVNDIINEILLESIASEQ